MIAVLGLVAAIAHAAPSTTSGTSAVVALVAPATAQPASETPAGAVSTPAPASSATTEMTPVHLLEHQERWVEAESLATVTLARISARPKPDSLEMADALYVIGEARVSRVAFSDRKGQDALERCLAIRQRILGPDHLDVATTELMLGRLLASSSRPDSALPHLEHGRDIRMARLAPGDTLIGDAWAQCGFAHRNMREFAKAIDEFQHDVDIREAYHGPDHPIIGSILAQMGYCLDRLGEYDRARAVLERALDIIGRALGPDALRRVVPLDYLAGVETDVGNHARSLELSQEALRVVLVNRPPDDPEVMRIRRNLAGSLLEIGDYAGMRSQLEPILPWYEARRGPNDWQTVDLCLNLGIACAGVDDTTAAMRYLRRVETAMTTGAAPPTGDLPYALAWQGKVLHAFGDDHAARAACERGLVYARSARHPSGYALVLLQYTLIEVLCALRDTTALDSADRTLERVAQDYELRSTTTGPVVDYWHARVAEELGRHDAAWTYALESFRRAHERLCWNVRALPDGQALQLSYEDIRHLDLVVDVSRRGPAARQEIAWDKLVRSRGLVRAELTRRRLPPELRSDTTVAVARDTWIRAQRAYAQRLVQTGGSPGDSAVAAKLEQLRSNSVSAERAYVATLAAHRAPVAPPEVGLADVRSRLQPGQALISIVEVDAPTDTAHLVALVARGSESGITRVELGPTPALHAAIDPWLARLAEPPAGGERHAGTAERDCRRAGVTARAAAWDPLARVFGDSHDVFLVADGPLLDFPWQALPDGESAYLVETGPRLHVLDAEWEMAAPPETTVSKSMLAVGDPDFELQTAPVVTTGPMIAAVTRASDPCAGGAGVTLEPLPASAGEAKDAAHAWLAGGSDRTADVLLGGDATEDAVKREAPGRAILHFATHGVVMRDTCLSGVSNQRGVGGVAPVDGPSASGSKTKTGGVSKGTKGGTPPTTPGPAPEPSPYADRRVWLALAGANRAREHRADENEGFLTAEEVVTLDLGGTDWVVLSACHTGLASTFPREGTLGLRRAFHLAGVRTVIASDWAVEDAATREWMDALYEARRAGAAAAAEAMQTASRRVLNARRHDRRSTHPFYWAAFTASGE
ncbi:MAG: CHAT domain-containing protein [Candidatus Eisenbacteria bacterium]